MYILYIDMNESGLFIIQLNQLKPSYYKNYKLAAHIG